MKTLSIQRPRPSTLMRTSASRRTLVKAKLVNWLPWSVLESQTTTVGRQHLGLAEARQRFLQSSNAESGVHRVR